MQDYAMIHSKLLLDLEKWLPGHEFISSDMSIKQVRAVALRTSFLKKLSPNGTNLEADARALEKFKRINASIPETFQFDAQSDAESWLWDLFRENLQSALSFDFSDVNFDLDYMRSNFNVGPGASRGVNSESFYTKLFESSLTATHPYLVALYRASIVHSDFWSAAEMQRHQTFGETIVEGNKLFFVPKTSEISRTCCTEPLLNMMFQKALGAFIEHRLRRHFGITLDVQPDYNRELARQGSVDGSFGTIDLVSASDSISWDLVKQVMPPNLLGFFRMFRCDTTILPDGSEQTLHMISTMGNGFTFPLQTIIFASAVRAVYQLKGLPCSCPRTQFGVFGDDIVVRREAYDAIVSLLTKLGFEVNGGKSFNSGSFRESCGHDWYNGHFVRGVYIRSLETRSEALSAINRLNRWSSFADIPLPNTVQALVRLFRVSHLKVPFSESDDAGIKVPFTNTVPKVLDNYWFAYRKSIEVGRRRAVPIDGTSAQVLAYRSFNPYGWVITLSEGFAQRSNPGFYPGLDGHVDPACLEDHVQWITLRRNPGDQKRTRVIRSATPFWDWADGCADIMFSSYERWKALVTVNLGDSLD